MRCQKYGRCGPENMDISLENFRNGNFGLNVASHACPFQEGT
jgi:hypothetical protein